MLKKTLALVGVTLSLILSTSAHSALVEYSYQGNMFTDVVNNILPAGETFTNTDSITGSFVVSDLGSSYYGNLTAESFESFSFSAGPVTISSSDALAQIQYFYVSTDAFGAIDSVEMLLFSENQEWFDLDPEGIRESISISPSSATARHEQCALLNRAETECNPNRNGGEFGNTFDEGRSLVTGVWTSQTINAVPVPAAAWLFGSALVGLAGIKRKK
ncbi:VPLPA-CTERM sorting domain-containing protein [Oceanicoccus sagamiensis]|uniref:PEP-CTERM protein-sorting domain-containing protein n=1 Tax=Oceanicoccus sagamiensis TaxID=716816 RepID=A0A1X9NB10_9GAMM|nr:VPLPA-CTERM sorting domain-containing protein [Oceanicoccus sagamiensis]ARN73105.1 hypothetical protein BST96_02680 [Oceanicoccus sagamiensis]